MDRITVTSTGWNPNYLPQNVAQEYGMFDALGLDVTRRPQTPWELVLSDLESGAADIALGGMWVPAMYHGIARDLVVVGQLNGRYAQAIVTRPGVGDFDWDWLAGRTLIVPGAGGTAGYTFISGLMRELGHDPSRVSYVRDLSTSMLTELFTGGLGDAMLADLVTAFRMQAQGVGHVAMLLAEPGGPLPNSVYYARRDRLDELSGRLGRFLTGVQQAMDEVAGDTDATRLHGQAAELFPHIDPGVLRAVVSHVLTTTTWKSVRVDPVAFDRWIGFQLDVPLIRQRIEYSELVDVRGMDVAAPAA